MTTTDQNLNHDFVKSMPNSQFTKKRQINIELKQAIQAFILLMSVVTDFRSLQLSLREPIATSLIYRCISRTAANLNIHLNTILWTVHDVKKSFKKVLKTGISRSK